jgi:CheY-like chemotaxis protein
LHKTKGSLLVDVQIPEMDGYEFVEIAKVTQMQSNSTIFVTAMSNEQNIYQKTRFRSN